MSNSAAEFRKRVVEITREWKDVPYKHRGTTKKGCDCGGLIIGVLQQMGFLKKFRLNFYRKDWNIHSSDNNALMGHLKEYAFEIGREKLEPGDCIVFKFGQRGSHLGLYLGKTQFLHVHEAAGKCTIDRLNQIAWEKRVRNIYRFNLDKLTVD